MTRPFAQAAERNAGPILNVLKLELASCASVFEIGSGTGQHAVMFGKHLPHLSWQTSDVAENCDGIRAWVRQAALPNVCEPLQTNVLVDQCPDGSFDSVFSANTAHIMHLDAVRRMFRLVGDILPAGGAFVLYGPFRQQGRYNTDSNASFDRSLRQRDPGMGIRDIELLDEFGDDENMRRRRLYAMPANNHIAVWTKTGGNR